MEHFTTEDRVCDVYDSEGKLRTNYVGLGPCGDLITSSQSLPKDMFGGPLQQYSTRRGSEEGLTGPGGEFSGRKEYT